MSNSSWSYRSCMDQRGGGGVPGKVSDGADDLLSTWPPKHYTCSFCKRRFKSAQALGGHMNIHRRAKAILISQSSMSPISSPPASSVSHRHPYYNIATGTTAADRDPLQNDESLVECPLVHAPHHTRIPSYPHLLPRLPMISITSSLSLRQKYPLSVAPIGYRHAPWCQCHHADQPFNGVIKTQKNSIRVEAKLNGLLSSRITHHDDAVVRLSLGNGLITSNSTDQQDIDLELRL